MESTTILEFDRLTRSDPLGKDTAAVCYGFRSFYRVKISQMQSFILGNAAAGALRISDTYATSIDTMVELY